VLNSNALTTTEAVLLYLKKYVTTAAADAVPTASTDDKTFTFPNTYIVQGTLTVTETPSGGAATDITGDISSTDYETGAFTFASAHTGTVKGNYSYLKLDRSDGYLIEQKINAVSDYVEKYIDRRLQNQTYTDEPHAGNGRQLLQLRQWPVTKLTKVAVSGTLLNPPADYAMSDADALRGQIYAPNGWSYDGALVGPVGEPIAPYRSYLITYSAGYTLPKDATGENPRTLPYDLEEACIELISAKIAVIGSENVKSESLGDASKSYYEDDLPPAIKAVLDRYRRYV
jgi:hypothetical protein